MAVGGPDGTGEKLAVESERCLLALILGMEVGDAVLAVEHADHDAEEDRRLSPRRLRRFLAPNSAQRQRE